MDQHETAGMGHNNPPADPVETLKATVNERAVAGKAWLELVAIENEEQAVKLNDFLSQLRESIKDADAWKAEAKAPLSKQITTIDTTYKALTEPLTNLGKKLKEKLTAFAQEKQRRLDEERRIAAEAARKAAEEAEAARKAAEKANDVVAEAEAAERAKQAAKLEKAAAKPVRTQVASGTGGGRTMSMRTYHVAQVENMNRAFAFFRDHPERGPELAKLLASWAEAERRAKDGAKEIPGITFIEEQRVA